MKMLRKIIHNKIIRDLVTYKIQPIRYSALFINGPKATDNFVYVSPQIDFSGYLNNKHTIQKELTKRQAENDLNKLERLWSVYEDLKNRKLQLTKKKEVISKELQQIINSNASDDEVQKLKLQLSLLKENISKLKTPLWSAEESAVIEYLKLPNHLHSLTPVKLNTVIYEYQSPPSNDKNHLNIGKQYDLIEFTKNNCYYLKNDAAIFELGAELHFSQLLKQNKFVQFSNPDFCKSFIVEACGEDPTDPNSTFILEHTEESKVSMENRLHLMGAGSMSSFFAYHAKNLLYAKVLPLKYFSIGRQYTPAHNTENSLFYVSQNTVVQTFAVAKNLKEMDQVMEELINIIKVAYRELGYHFRLSFITANKLKTWESLRLSIEMYSSSLKDYVEVGHVSVSEDFISKRLMFMYNEGKENKFCFVLSGTIFNVPKSLACALEQDETFSIPPQFRMDKWSC